jgi:hypothetical protein
MGTVREHFSMREAGTIDVLCRTEEEENEEDGGILIIYILAEHRTMVRVSLPMHTRPIIFNTPMSR